MVGRDAACEISLDDPLVSRRHATFRAQGAALCLVDHGSMNGTRVNGAPVKGEQGLAHRDRVQVGSHVFLVIDGSRERRGAGPTIQHPTATVAALDGVERALSAGSLDSAAHVLGTLWASFAEPSARVEPAELARVSRLLLALCERQRDPAPLERVFQIHVARKQVPDSAVLDALQRALSSIGGAGTNATEAYLLAMRPHIAALSVQEQVRLRRIETIARKMAGGGA